VRRRTATRLRTGVFLAGAVVLGVSLAYGVVGLPAGGTADGVYARTLGELAIDRRALNTVSGVLFDLRSLDTLGEALALFAAAAGLQVVLSEQQGEGRTDVPRAGRPDRSTPPTSDAVRTIALAFVPPVTALALVVTFRGHLGVGGGLQGGSLGLAALALVFLGGRYQAQRRLAPDAVLDVEETVGIGGYVALGLVGLAVGGSLLANVLPLGTPGRLLSAGTIAILSLLIAIEARAALLLIVTEAQEEPLEREPAG
jgi:multicomponent Na+:H+ antiporter subunit B